MIHYSRYKNQNQIIEFIERNSNHIQIVIGTKFIPFGQGQSPKIWDYADGIDTMQWLNKLSN
jgi:hypothetical protein